MSLADEDTALGSVEATVQYWQRRLRTLSSRGAGIPSELVRIATCHQKLRDAFDVRDRLDQAERQAEQYVLLLKTIADQNADQNGLNRSGQKPDKTADRRLDLIDATMRLAAIRKKRGNVDEPQKVSAEIERELEQLAELGNDNTQARRINQLKFELRELGKD